MPPPEKDINSLSLYYKNVAHIIMAHLNNSFIKTFNTFDTRIIEMCHYYMGYLTLPLIYDQRRFNFFRKLKSIWSSYVSLLFNLFDKSEFDKKMCFKHHIKSTMSDVAVLTHFGLRLERRCNDNNADCVNRVQSPSSD